MRGILRDVRRPFRPWNRRYRSIGEGGRARTPPAPHDLIFSIGVTILLTVGVRFAVDWLVPLSR